jgi:hypothetical protein
MKSTARISKNSSLTFEKYNTVRLRIPKSS